MMQTTYPDTDYNERAPPQVTGTTEILYDTQGVTYKGRCTRLDPSVTPLRVAVFSGADGMGANAVDDGMYTSGGGAKAITLHIVCDNRAIKMAPSTFARNYYYLRSGACY